MANKLHTECNSSVSGRWNPEGERHQEGQKNAGNDEGVDVETHTTSDCHRVGEIIELQMTTWTAVIVLDLL